jgi:pimeloyl-ACP methyl ester carboxylesterase
MVKGLAIGIAAATVAFLTALPVKAETVQLSYKDIKLNGELTIPDNGTLGDGVVLITHGTLAHNGMETIVMLRESLAERGIASLAISLGFRVDNRTGFYDCAAGVNRHRHEDALDEIGAWMDWLKGQGAGRIALMGHSRGGAQTAWFAAERDDPGVRAVLLLAPAAMDPYASAASYKRRFGKDLSTLLKKAEGMPPDALLEGVPFLQCENATVTAASFISYYADEPRRNTPGLLPRIGKPTLVVAGSEDTVVVGLKGFIEPLVGENLRFLEVDGADHFFLDLFMEDVADAVDEFLQERW